MNALHQSLEAATAVYYKPRKIALLMIAHPSAFAYVSVLAMILISIMAVTLCVVFGSFWPLLYCIGPLLLAILYISYELGRELKMMNKVIEAVRLETGNKLSVLEARPMVHMIMGYLFAEQVIQENQ